MLDLLCGQLFMYCTLYTSSLKIWVLLMKQFSYFVVLSLININPAMVAWFVRGLTSHSVDGTLRRMVVQILLRTHKYDGTIMDPLMLIRHISKIN